MSNQGLQRKLVAILSADVAGPSRSHAAAGGHAPSTSLLDSGGPSGAEAIGKVVRRTVRPRGAARAGRQQRDALKAADDLLARYPDTLDALVIRIGSSVALGRTEDAQRSAEVLRHHHPGFRVDAFATTQPHMDPAQLERVTGALRNAGLE